MSPCGCSGEDWSNNKKEVFMQNKNPLILLATVVLIAVGISWVISREVENPPSLPTETSREERTETLAPTPTLVEPKPTEGLDLAATHRMTEEEGQDLIRKAHERVGNATSVEVRIRFELSQRLVDRGIEGDLRFDSLNGTLCRVEATSLQPKVRGNLQGEWDYQKTMGIVVSTTGMRRVDYLTHKVYDLLFDSTVEGMTTYTDQFKKQAHEILSNPLADLLSKVPLEDRLKEVVRVTLVKSSEGDEIEVLSRMTRPMIESFGKSNFRGVFPHLDHAFFEDVALRTDHFDAETKELLRTGYWSAERKEKVRQIYSEIHVGKPLPSNPFDLELPDPATVNNVTLNLEQKLARGLRADDRFGPQAAEGDLTEVTATIDDSAVTTDKDLVTPPHSSLTLSKKPCANG
jgi:hypothetical protein